MWSYFNPRGLRRPRRLSISALRNSVNFNPRGLRRPRRGSHYSAGICRLFQSTRSSQTSTQVLWNLRDPASHFNPRGLRRPRPKLNIATSWLDDFNPRGLRRPRPISSSSKTALESISIHEVFADLDIKSLINSLSVISISIHEVFADLDKLSILRSIRCSHFNPRGLRRPRRPGLWMVSRRPYFNPRGLRRPRRGSTPEWQAITTISIHEVFADLDV